MEEIRGIRRRTWAQINLGSARANYQAVREAVAREVKVCCVVKADAYGHGAPMLAKAYERWGADFLAVSNLEEALQLRQAQIRLPILILGYSPTECAALLAEHDFSQCVYSYEYGEELADCAERAGVRVKIHLKLDTGMGRIGFRCFGTHAEELEQAAQICRKKALIPEGIFTHFAVADEGEDGEADTQTQRERFEGGIRFLEERGISFAIRHCANSAAIFDYPECHMDMVRAGIVLYGFAPSEKVRRLPPLTPVMTLMSVISHLKTLDVGETVSYGKTFRAERRMRVATVPIGYADGFSRRLGNGRYAVKIGSAYAPILGRVCMDQLMVDVTDLPCRRGDPVLIFGCDAICSAEHMAQILETIPYEISCDVAKRVPRLYVEDGRGIAWQDDLIPTDSEF